MLRRSIGFVVLLLLLFGIAPVDRVTAQTKSTAKSKSPYAGYTKQKIEGFTVYVQDEVLKHQDDEQFEVRPLETLKIELETVTHVMKADYVVKLRNLPVFADWDKPEGNLPPNVIAYYTSGKDERGNCIEILKMNFITKHHQPSVVDPECVILHECAHAVDHAIYQMRNPVILKAYDVAMERRLYGEPPSRKGETAKIYAATSPAEYFAELTCAYLDKGRKPIVTRDELKALDTEGYKMMEQVWGKNPERFALKPKKTTAPTPVSKSEYTPKSEQKPPKEKAADAPPDAEKAASDKLKAIEYLIGVGKKDSAKEKLTDLIKTYPRSEAAKKAEELLKTLDKQ